MKVIEVSIIETNVYKMAVEVPDDFPEHRAPHTPSIETKRLLATWNAYGSASDDYSDTIQARVASWEPVQHPNPYWAVPYWAMPLEEESCE